MTPLAFYDVIQAPAVLALSGIRGLSNLDSPPARCMLLAIAGQESSWVFRQQEPTPHARGFWQCERGGAVAAMLAGERSRTALIAVCIAYSIRPILDDVFEAIAWHDPLAYALARLLLASDPAPLPAIGDEAAAWENYTRLWRPGKPSRERWKLVYPAACQTIEEVAARRAVA